MSDASWLVVLFVASSVCAAYSGWQVLCPMRLRRVRVIWLTSQHFRARADVWYWRTVFLLAAVSCTGTAAIVAAGITNRPALSGLGMVVIVLTHHIAYKVVSL